MKSYYDKLTGNGYEIGKDAKIKVNQLKPKAHNKVNVICECCGNKLQLALSKYNQNKEKYGFYSCKSCSSKKRKMTCKNMYGVEHVSQREESKERMKEFMGSQYFRDKSVETQLEKHNGKLYVQTNDFKSVMNNLPEEIRKGISDNVKKTFLNKYGFTSSLQHPEIKEKRKNSMIERYGFEHSMQNEIIFNKAKETYKEKYGTEYAIQSDIVKDKIIKTFLTKYGVDNPRKSKIIIQKILDTKIAKGLCIDVSKLEGFEKYKREIKLYTRRSKHELFNNWNGYDFYDGEYIKDNLKLYPTDKLYPSIDHKISVFNGYLRGILAEEISHIDNLCITKRGINSSKGKKDVTEFIELFKDLTNI